MIFRLRLPTDRLEDKYRIDTKSSSLHSEYVMVSSHITLSGCFSTEHCGSQRCRSSNSVCVGSRVCYYGRRVVVVLAIYKIMRTCRVGWRCNNAMPNARRACLSLHSEGVPTLHLGTLKIKVSSLGTPYGASLNFYCERRRKLLGGNDKSPN